MMKLLVDCMPLSTGGGVQVAIAFLDGLSRRRDIDWSAVLPAGMKSVMPANLVADGRRITFLAKSSLVDILRANRCLHAIVQADNPDVVFTVFGPAYFKANAPHLVGFALPNLIYDRDGVLHRDFRAIDRIADFARRAMVRWADYFVVETETVRHRLAKGLGIDDTRISVIGNSVNPLLERHPPEPVPASGRFGILVPSAYYRHKNLEILPEIAALLVRHAPGLDFEFRLTLDPTSAPWKRLTEAAAQRSVADRLTTLGVLPLDQLARAYREASAVLLPTLREASTAVYPESFHFRRPLLTSDLDFAHELCGGAALYADPASPADFAGQLARIAAEQGLAAELVDKGVIRLATTYPTPEQKFEQQLALLARVARLHGYETGSDGRRSEGDR